MPFGICSIGHTVECLIPTLAAVLKLVFIIACTSLCAYVGVKFVWNYNLIYLNYNWYNFSSVGKWSSNCTCILGRKFLKWLWWCTGWTGVSWTVQDWQLTGDFARGHFPWRFLSGKESEGQNWLNIPPARVSFGRGRWLRPIRILSTAYKRIWSY